MKKLLMSIALISAWVCTSASAAIITSANSKIHNDEIKKLYQQHTKILSKPIAERIAFYSEYFLGRPYLSAPLGEGATGEFVQQPLFRADGFDCQTYVETVLALANAKNFDQFAKTINKIRYRDGKVAFAQRNHFTSVDWNINNAQNGFVKDITYQIIDSNKKPVAAIASTIIDKPSWYQHLQSSTLQFPQAIDAQQEQQLLQKLHNISKQVKPEKSVMLYVPKTQLIDKDGNPNQQILKQIPDAAIIEIIRPNWQIKNKIGTNLNVSHMGFAIRTPEGLMFRNASTVHKKVNDELLVEYVKEMMSNDTIQGINIERINSR